MALGSGTVEVLMHGHRPVLVAAVGELTPTSRALAVIRDEHRALAAVLHAWQDRLANPAAGPVDAAAQLPALDFMELFSRERHHPKESEHLFRLLRLRSGALNAELDELDRQHQRDHELLASLRSAVESGAADLLQRLGAYAEFMWEHLGREEGVVLPAAQKHLLAQDCEELDRVFATERDEDALALAGLARRALVSLAE